MNMSRFWCSWERKWVHLVGPRLSARHCIEVPCIWSGLEIWLGGKENSLITKGQVWVCCQVLLWMCNQLCLDSLNVIQWFLRMSFLTETDSKWMRCYVCVSLCGTAKLAYSWRLGTWANNALENAHNSVTAGKNGLEFPLFLNIFHSSITI